MRVLLMMLALAVPMFAQADPAALKGKIKWISEAPVEKIVGTAEGTAALTVDLADLSTLKGTLNVAVGSMMSGNEKRDGHLKSADWLDAAKHPNISFAIETVKVVETKKNDKGITVAKLEVAGKFTLHGVTTALTTQAKVKVKGQKMKIKTKFTIKLDDYQIKGRDGIVGKKVGSTIEIEASFKGKVGA